jgi:hypothetical protein
MIVTKRETTDELKKLFCKEWWLHVILTPDDNKITVFSNGIIPIGGQDIPISGDGDKLLS